METMRVFIPGQNCESETAEDIVCISVEVGISIANYFISLVRYKHWGATPQQRKYGTERSLCRIFFVEEVLGYCSVGFSRVFFAFQTDTRMCSLFHPWTNSNL